MSGQMLVTYCSPTLAGLKTGNLFSLSFESREELNRNIREFNRILSPKGICVLPLRFTEGHALIYVFRPAALEKDLADEECRKLLREAGYPSGRLYGCIRELIGRLKAGGEFPHEIGLFLSYPPEDVRGFIANKAGKSKCTGTWKVYGDEQRARKMFRRFRRCTDIYCRKWNEGMPLERLAVPGV